MDPADLPPWLRPLAAAVAGASAADLTRFAPPPGYEGRASAVLMLLAEGERGPDLLLTQRSPAMRAHSGQPAFPGGAWEADDADAAACALREAAEEVGLDPSSVAVVAELPELWVPVTGFVVTPVLGWWREPGPVSPQESEVAEVHRVPLADLADPVNRVRVRHPSGYIGPGFEVAGMVVWGFTGGLADALLTMGGWFQPWQPGRLVDIEQGGVPPDEVRP
jgi:8-oxo-dGTP pyrophosphatase MutT (NUDIX family)